MTEYNSLIPRIKNRVYCTKKRREAFFLCNTIAMYTLRSILYCSAYNVHINGVSERICAMQEDSMLPAKTSASADGFAIVTVHVLYRIPDYLDILQEFWWQQFDLVPHLPRIREFLKFWEQNLDGPLYSVTVASSLLVKPTELRLSDKRLLIN